MVERDLTDEEMSVFDSMDNMDSVREMKVVGDETSHRFTNCEMESVCGE